MDSFAIGNFLIIRNDRKGKCQIFLGVDRRKKVIVQISQASYDKNFCDLILINFFGVGIFFATSPTRLWSCVCAFPRLPYLIARLRYVDARLQFTIRNYEWSCYRPIIMRMIWIDSFLPSTVSFDQIYSYLWQMYSISDTSTCQNPE